MSREVCGICWCPYDEDTGECACEPGVVVLTPWFHPTETPLRVGVYQRIRWQEDDPFFSYWDGRLWWPSGVTVDEAHIRYAAYLPYGVPRWVSQVLQWRGEMR